MIERGGLDADDRPAVRRVRLRLLSDRQSAERILAVDRSCEHGEHATTSLPIVGIPGMRAVQNRDMSVAEMLQFPVYETRARADRCVRSTRATRAPDSSTRSRASRSPERRRGTGTCTPGALAARKPSRSGHASFTWNAHARPLTDFTGDTAAGPNGLWTGKPPYHWLAPPPRSAVSFTTPPLTSNTTVIGAGAVHVWLKASTPNVDLQATISEIRPDGKETFVQGGWVRANERKLDQRKSTLLEPVLSLRASGVQALPRKRYVEVTIPLYYEGHAYRTGSRIRVTITAPNGDQPVVRRDESQGQGERHGGVRQADAVEPDPPGRARPQRADVAPALPGAARRALPLRLTGFVQTLPSVTRAAGRSARGARPGPRRSWRS